jgi:hypothetical protein
VGITSRIKEILAAKSKPEAYPTVTARVSVDEEGQYGAQVDRFLRGLSVIAAKFPFEFYNVIDNLTMIDPYISKFHQTTINMGNLGHTLELDTDSESKADAAIAVANDLAARCFPISGGMDGLVNAMLSQVARTGGMCVEWVPDKTLSRVERAFVIPIKTLRWRYNAKNELELVQIQNDGLVPLNMTQTSYHNATIRDTNPYPIPPAIAALESCSAHRTIIEKIKDWMEKVSALGVLLASVSPPPREIGETQAQYDLKAQAYLEKIAKSIQDNMSTGIGVGYNNIEFTFQNTQSAAQGAQDILQIVLHGLFAALHRDPLFFGWHFNSTESYARVVYDEMVQGIKAFQLGLKRLLEHGHRLNFALHGMGDVGVSVHFNSGASIDAFRDAEAEYMKTQAIIAQIEPGVLSIEEARKILGHDDRKAESGKFVASFNKSDRRYQILRLHNQWVGAEFDEGEEYEDWVEKQLSSANSEGSKALLLWLLLFVNSRDLPDKESFIREGVTRFISAAEGSISKRQISGRARDYLTKEWNKGRTANGSISNKELAAIAFLAGAVEARVISEYLSRSTQRQSSIEAFLNKIYSGIKTGDGSGAVALEIASLSDRLADNAASVIASTSVRRARVWAKLYSMERDGVELYRVDGPRDDRKCDFCWGMLDRVFSVSNATDRIRDAIENGYDEFERNMPFLKDLIGIEDLKKMSDYEVQNTGFAAPPYHPNCRDYLVEVKTN